MSSENLNIVRPGNLIWPGTRISPIKWHVGGQPWYPAECSVPDPSLLKCNVCGERLRHILHLALPPLEETKESSTHALMYLFVCITPNCGKESGSWRALRCQWHSPLPKTARENSSNAKKTATKAKAATTLTTAGWGLGDIYKNTDNTPASSGFDFSDLEAALDAMNQKTETTTSTAATSVPAVKEEEKIEELEEVELQQQEDEPIPLPGFYLEVADSEVLEARIEKQTKRNGGGGGGGGGGKGTKDDTLEHIYDLLEKYKESTSEGEIERLINYEDEEEEEEKEKKAKQKAANRGEEIADSVTWDGEGYEEDIVLAVDGRKGVDQTFLKFMKKLQRVPDQCVRQGRGDDDGTAMPPLLCPSLKTSVEPGVCSSCGVPRVFEYQLMAPTIAALEESADWLKEEGLEDGAVERPPTSWGWVTVAVFGCRDRCWGGSKRGYREEKVVVYEEE